MATFDAVVVGAGTAGESVTWALQREGLQVALIERELVGGLCAYWGCIPSKTLIRPGTIEWEARHGFGVSQPELDWPKICSYRNWMVRDYNDSSAVEKLRQNNIAFYRGNARISGKGAVEVNGETLRSEHIVIATGSEASVPPIPGLKEAGYWTNREGTAFTEVPKSVVVIGGGAVGCELGQAIHHLGAEVAIVEETDQLLGHESPDAACYVQRAFEREGIAVHTGRKITKVERSGNTRTVTMDNGKALQGEVVLVATGRRPRLEGLGHENLGIETDRQGIKVDQYCRAADGVWAIGDVTGGGFTHVADYQGSIAAADILGKPRPAHLQTVPRVTFTDPEVAAVGATNQQGSDVAHVHVDLDAASRTYTYGQHLHGGLSLFADRKRRVLTGAWAAGPLAGEWVQWATLAIRAEIPVDVLDDTILAFPTFTRLYLEPLHELRRTLGSTTS